MKLEGAIQKGPFITGSNVQVAMIDGRTVDPTGQTFNTTTRNDLGEFELTLPATGTAEITTTGYYFNEVSGALSGSQLSMRALANFTSSGTQFVYVNALTQMSYLRAKKLIKDGTAFADAITKAEGELRSSFGLLTRDQMAAGTAMNLLGGDTDDNAYLFAMSCVLGQAAKIEAPDTVDAKLQELISAVALDLESDGTIGQTLKDKLAAGLVGLNPGACTANMTKRLADTGSSATVPNIFRVLDFDKDGVRDLDDDDADGDGVKQLLRMNSPGGVFALASDGTVSLIGGSYTDWPAPKAIQGLTNVVSLTRASLGGAFAVKGDGTVWGFSEREAPTQVAGLTDVAAMAAIVRSPAEVSVLLKKGGTVWQRGSVACAGVEDRDWNVGLSEVTGVYGMGGQWAEAPVALKKDGTLWKWSTVCKEAGPEFTLAQIANDVSFVAGFGEVYVRKDGTVWNAFGSSGKIDGLSGVVALSSRASPAVLADGSVTETFDESGKYHPVAIPR